MKRQVVCNNNFRFFSKNIENSEKIMTSLKIISVPEVVISLLAFLFLEKKIRQFPELTPVLFV